MAHKHSVYDTDLHFVIDPITRKITSTSGKVLLMQNDHNSERFTFEIPRYVEGHDMSLCDTVEIHYINTDSNNKRNTSDDVYPVEDLQVSPDSEETVIFSWLISQNATLYPGTLHFIIRFACIEETVIEYQWFTDIYTSIGISKGIFNTDVITDNANSDVLAAWKEEILASIEQFTSGSNAGTLDGHDSSYFATATSVERLSAAPAVATFLASSWSGAGPYTQTVSVEGMVDTDTPIPMFVDDATSLDESSKKLAAYSCISYFDSGTGQVTATCKYKKPEVNVTVAFKGV